MAALRPARAGRAAIEARIRAALDSLRPLLHLETCEIDLLEFHEERGIAVLRVQGGCPHCDMSAAMLMQGIEAHLRSRVPEIREVRAASES